MPVEQEPLSLRLSMRDLTAQDSAEMLRETYGRTVMRTEIAPLGEGPSHLDMDFCAMPGLGMAIGACSPFSSHRTRALIDNDDLVLLVALEGSTVMQHRGREVLIADGEALLMMNDEVGLNRMQSDFRCLNLSIPRTLLQPMIGDPAAVLMRPIDREAEALRLLVHYSAGLRTLLPGSSPDLRHAAVHHVHDLAALAIGAARTAGEIAQGRGLRAARLHAIKSDITANLAGDLSTETLAARHRVSPRYIRKLFEMEGLSLSEFVLTQRLLHAWRALTDPRQAHRTISAIAFEAGFNDLSYFNRAFRRRYSATPSDIRGSAAKPS